MKKQVLSATIACSLGYAANGFADGPIDGSLYGKVNISVVNTDTNSGDTWKLNSNASRLGVKGKTKITDDLYAIYKAEFEVCVDDGDCKGQTFTQRNIMGGIRGNFGTLWAGKHDSPTKLAQNKIDLFNDMEGDIKHTFAGENRVSNMIAYSSPNLNGFSTTLAMIPGEDTDVDGDGQNDTGLSDAISYSLSYSKDNLYVAVAGDQDVQQDDGFSQDLLRLVVQYKIEALKLGFMYQQNERNNGSLDQSGYFFSAAYRIDKTTVKMQYGAIEDDRHGDKEKTLSLGADYRLAKNTKAFVFYTDNTDSAVNVSDEEERSFAVGMEHKF